MPEPSTVAAITHRAAGVPNRISPLSPPSRQSARVGDAGRDPAPPARITCDAPHLAPPERPPMDDAALIAHINELVAEEQKLQETPDHDPARLRELEVMLDQCWDLLRQRRARREFGLDPDDATARDADTVENYKQ